MQTLCTDGNIISNDNYIRFIINIYYLLHLEVSPK
jgi:hypothetical protein